jgi:hypothetical protein
VLIEYEDGNGTYCCMMPGVFLVDLGVDGEVILKWILRTRDITALVEFLSFCEWASDVALINTALNV